MYIINHYIFVAGHVEHFADKCGGVPAWLDKNTYYTAFTEGWGLYSENPILSDDTDTYKDNLLQKYGMVKWQVRVMKLRSRASYLKAIAVLRKHRRPFSNGLIIHQVGTKEFPSMTAYMVPSISRQNRNFFKFVLSHSISKRYQIQRKHHQIQMFVLKASQLG